MEQLSVRNGQLSSENQRLKAMGGANSKLEEENRELADLIDRKNKEIKQL